MQPDPSDPTKLFCRRIPNPVSQEKESGPEESSRIPSPNQTGSDTTKPLSDVTGEAGQQGFETVNVLRVQIGGEEYLKVIKPDKNPHPVADDTAAVQKTPAPDLPKVSRRLASLKRCNDRQCTLPKAVSSRKGKPAKRDDMDGEGG
jgi:hypothetical protein